jgi:hypothetical protein
MDPIHIFPVHDLISRTVDQRELQQRLELRYARGAERSSIRRRRRQRFVQLLTGWRRSRTAAVTLASHLAD